MRSSLTNLGDAVFGVHSYLYISFRRTLLLKKPLQPLQASIP